MNRKYMNKEDIILNLAFVFNKELFNAKKISFMLFKYTNDELLKKLNLSDES